VTAISNENNGVESLRRSEVAPRSYDIISTTPVVHSSDYSRRNNANQHQHCETSFQNEKLEEKYDKTSVEKKETQLTSLELGESALLSSSLSTRANEDDVVGVYIIIEKKVQVRLIEE
jgi:hypothetical protein